MVQRPPRTQQRTGLADVARHAGYAVSTVSRVINNRSEGFSVRPQVRETILASVAELGYRPNINARTLRRQSTGYIAVLGLRMLARAVHDPSDSVVDRMAETLAREGLHLTSAYVGATGDCYQLPPWQVDGAIVVRSTAEEDFRHVDASGMPYVAINGIAGTGGSSVLVEDPAAMADVLGHLHGLGHRKIGYFSHADRFGTHHSQRDRADAYDAFMRDAGEEPIRHVSVEEGEIARPLHRCLDAGMTAVVTYNHYLALEVLAACSEFGVGVPDRLSVVTFNDEYPMAQLRPGVTCMAHPADAMAEAATRLLLKQLREDAKPEQVCLPMTLVERASTGLPPA